MILYALTIFCSAFLLFLVQPILAKQILPWFGGSAAVWATCLVFFQTVLLAGYAYCDVVIPRASPRDQVRLQIALLVIALAFLPIVPAAHWKPVGSENPSWLILGLLVATIGLPYLLLSTTSPLIQAWFARSFPGASPYRLFALSNLASMLALIGYPFLLEPWVSTRAQAMGWSVGFAAFVVLCIASGLRSLRSAAARANSAISTAETATPPASTLAAAAPAAAPNPGASGVHRATEAMLGHAALENGLRTGNDASITGDDGSRVDDAPPTAARQMLWLTLAATASFLLLAVSNHITQNISSIPLLWIVPLSLYLLTFILCFDGRGWYRRELFLAITATALGVMAWTGSDPDLTHDLQIQIGVFCVGLFIACMFCHGELVLAKPAPRHLTRFYLMVSLGGAVGSVLVGMVAPLVLPAYFELPIGLMVCALLLMWQSRHLHVAFPVLALGASIASASALFYDVRHFYEDTLYATRNFYGVLRVKELGSGENHRRSLVHGTILHGNQYLDASARTLPTTYYTGTSGIGRLLETLQAQHRPLRVGVIGLGTGTLATYGREGDVYRFYDINPAVIEVAQRDFTYLGDSKATIEFGLGDARLVLDREPSQQFDVLAIDAFSSDSIPTHLLTAEALAIFRKHLCPGGVVAFHVTNRFLNLIPVVERLAENAGVAAVHVPDEGENDDKASRSDWVLVSDDRSLLATPLIADAATEIEAKPGWRLWTDDFNNLVQVLK